eukprot:scaffold152027_cov28-Tisochrysis_lutea.AAC.1
MKAKAMDGTMDPFLREKRQPGRGRPRSGRRRNARDRREYTNSSTPRHPGAPCEHRLEAAEVLGGDDGRDAGSQPLKAGGIRSSPFPPVRVFLLS